MQCLSQDVAEPSQIKAFPLAKQDLATWKLQDEYGVFPYLLRFKNGKWGSIRWSANALLVSLSFLHGKKAAFAHTPPESACDNPCRSEFMCSPQEVAAADGSFAGF